MSTPCSQFVASSVPRPSGARRCAAASSSTPEVGELSAASDADDLDAPSTSGRNSPSAGPNNDIVVILVEPKRGENIGAAARGMKNFGLRELRLVRPAGGEWPNEKARAVAARAVDLIDAAKVRGRACGGLDAAWGEGCWTKRARRFGGTV